MLNDNNVIQKSTNLLDELKSSKLTMQQLKAIDVYLSRINSHNPQQRSVIFDSEDILKIFGDIPLRRLKTALKELQEITVTDIASDEPDTTTERTVHLFEMTELEYNNSSEQASRFSLTCTESAMRYIFNIEELRYLQYKLRNIIDLKNKYSYHLFLWIVNQKCKYRNYPELLQAALSIEVKDLAEILKTPYTAYKDINRYILKPCIAEINSSTSLELTYTPLKKNGVTFKIEFEVTDWGDLDKISKAIETITAPEGGERNEPPEEQEPEQQPILNDDIQIILDIYPQFTAAEVKAIYNRILKLQPDKGSTRTARVDYFKAVYDDTVRENEKKIRQGKQPIRDYAAYISKTLDNRIQAGETE